MATRTKMESLADRIRLGREVIGYGDSLTQKSAERAARVGQ